MKSMILAAGLGTRLLPYTEKRPKPLFPVVNTPLLHLTISQMRKAGFLEIIVNAHHLQDQIAAALRDTTGILLQSEDVILGTGGGLRMALPHFGKEPVLVVNGDIYHTIPYREVYQFHRESGADVTLVLHDFPRFNDVSVDERLRVTGFNRSGNNGQQERILAFTGIHVINPEVLHSIPPGSSSCIIDCYRKLLQQGGSIRAYLASGHFWTDMGTPADYLQLHADILAQRVPPYEELAGAVAEAPFAGAENASIEKDVTLRDWVCLGKGVRLEAGVILQRAVVWDGARITAGSIIKDAIVTS